MHGPSTPKRRRLGQAIILGMGVLVLAGCAADYSLVQPGATGAGSYYTSEETYAPPGYYDESFGDYYMGETDFGFGTIYGPSFTFGLGFGDPCGWGCGTGYFGGWPWYYGGGAYPYRWGHHRWGTHRHHGNSDAVGTARPSRPWLKPDHPRVPPQHVAHVPDAPAAVPAQPARRLADRRPLGSASFAPHAFEHMHMSRPQVAPRPAAALEQPALAMPATHAFATPPSWPTRATPPHDFARPSARPAPPMRVASPPPPPRSDHAIPARIR